MLIINVPAGEEVITTATKRLADAGISHGAIVSVIGAVEGCAISTMPADDAGRDIVREYADPFELLGCGEVVDGVPHVHVTVGREDGTALAGHLHWARVKTWFVRLYVAPDGEQEGP